MNRWGARIVALTVVAAGVFFVVTMPRSIESSALDGHRPDLANGETLFWAGGCASCHAAPDSEGDERLVLGGGVELATPFGTFRAPNISSDNEAGIGAWTDLEFTNAMVKGVSPDGRHYYPAFPYSYYQRMPIGDLVDLKAFLDTLPATSNEVEGHTLGFPFNIRRGLGLWKLLYLDGETFASVPGESPLVRRGRYLVQGPGHCGACHTPRDALGGSLADRFLAGAASPETASESGDHSDGSTGRMPNITPHADGIGDWSEGDIAYSLESGFDPDFDSFGGSMVEVQKNLAHLLAEDRRAIAAYLKSIPALPSEVTAEPGPDES